MWVPYPSIIQFLDNKEFWILWWFLIGKLWLIFTTLVLRWILSLIIYPPWYNKYLLKNYQSIMREYQSQQILFFTFTLYGFTVTVVSLWYYIIVLFGIEKFLVNFSGFYGKSLVNLTVVQVQISWSVGFRILIVIIY